MAVRTDSSAQQREESSQSTGGGSGITSQRLALFTGAAILLIALFQLQTGGTERVVVAVPQPNPAGGDDVEPVPVQPVAGSPTAGKTTVVAAAPSSPAVTEPPLPVNKNKKKRNTILHDYHSMTLNELYGDTHGNALPKYPEAMCELNVLYTGNCRIAEGEETWIECVQRLGAKNFDKILNTRCRKLPVWQSLLANDTSTPGARDWQKLSRGFVYDSQTFTDDETIPYIPPNKRPVAVFTPPRRCGNGCVHYPISFSMPSANIAKKVDRQKWWEFLPYVPGEFPFGGDPKYNFYYQDEWLKDQLHRHSYYAFTHKRGGWDCMRHLEILASGAIPYFVDIEQCPQYSIANYPKSLIKEAMAVPGVDHVGEARRDAERINNDFFSKRPGGRVHFKKPGTIAMQRFDREVYFEMADQLLEHAREHMTTAAIVGYILRTIKYEEPKHVLLIGPFTPDYLHLTVEHGLSDLGIDTTVFGHTTSWVLQMVGDAANVTEAALEEHRAAEAAKNGKPLPNHGWFYGFRTSPSVVKHSGVGSAKDAAFTARIANGDFDMVIYTYTENNSPIESRPFWEAVRAAIPHGRRVFLHGGDDVEDPDRGSLEACQHGTLFKREMRDVEC